MQRRLVSHLDELREGAFYRGWRGQGDATAPAHGFYIGNDGHSNALTAL